MKFIIDNILWIVVALLSGGALLWMSMAGRGRKATPQEATLLMNRSKTLVLDVRDVAQFATGHIREAKNIPLAELSTRIGELDKFKGRTMIVVCQSGARAGAALRQLGQAGFADALLLEGGIEAWSGQNLPPIK